MKNLIKLVINLTLLCLIFLNSSFLFSQKKINEFTVVLDAGHGGKDPGNRGNGYYEKNIALSIALKVGAELEKQSNIKVIYTRKKDVFVNLFKRAEIANKAKADLFISIHCDSHSSNAYGAGTFVLGLHANQRNFEIAKKENSVIFKEENYEQKYDGFDPNSPESVISLVLMQEDYLDQSIVIADLIQKAFVSDLKRKNRTVKQAGFIVLKYTYMPSVLVETGFLTNKKEGAYLNSKKGQTEMSKSIAKGILRYRNSISSEVIKNDSELRYIPTIILTTSNNRKDMLECYKIGVSGYVLKPLKLINIKLHPYFINFDTARNPFSKSSISISCVTTWSRSSLPERRKFSI